VSLDRWLATPLARAASCALLAALPLLVVRWRYLRLLRRRELDPAALTAYWWCGLWNVVFLAFVILFLPLHAGLALAVVWPLLAIATWAAGRLWSPR